LLGRLRGGLGCRRILANCRLRLCGSRYGGSGRLLFRDIRRLHRHTPVKGAFRRAGKADIRAKHESILPAGHLGAAFDGIGCDHISILPRRCTCSRHDRPLSRRRLDTGMTGVFAPLPYAIGRILKSGSGEAHGSVHTHHKRTYFGLLEIKNKG
jgi:hypothetical protein